MLLILKKNVILIKEMEMVDGSCRLKEVEKGERNIKNNEKKIDINFSIILMRCLILTGWMSE